MSHTEWWRTAVIYQIYPRSFADSDGDGIGDLDGITDRLNDVAALGVDAIWLSPFYTSPQKDAGYDVADYCDVDPLFGDMDAFDRLLTTAHRLGLRVIIDLVPNHTSSEHEWFRRALASSPGSAERERYLFRDGRGDGSLPSNNWQSVFGGPAWTRVTEADGTPGQWYLHLFDSSQPDLNWRNDWVGEQFRGILRFWLDKGVDGFRVDVAHGLVKAEGLPDEDPRGAVGLGGAAKPYWSQPEVHEIYRDWHKVLAEYDSRALCGEAWADPPSQLALWVRPDEMQQTFNFSYLETPWSAPALRSVITDSLAAFGSVGAPSTWVLSNHDVIRHRTRLALTGPSPQGDGIGPANAHLLGDPAVEERRARAAAALMLALPGSAYLYQGEELGLPEVVDLPDTARQDPTWFRTDRERYGRDGCRVPLPWTAGDPAYGFSSTGRSWLPQPASWAQFARSVQERDEASFLSLYQRLLTERRAHSLGKGRLEWLDRGDEVVAFRNTGSADVRHEQSPAASDRGLTIVTNLSAEAVALPDLDLLLASGPLEASLLPPDTTAWLIG